MRFFKQSVALALILGVASLSHASDIVTKNLQFAKGASSATVKGSLVGYQTIDYKVGANAGQVMKVSFKSSNASNYFNVLPPGSNDSALFVGSSSGDNWNGRLTQKGVYTIRVYLMRNAARRNEKANYTLTTSITGRPAASAAVRTTAAPGDAKVKGTPYHATGPLDCSMGSAPMGSTQCTFGVIRGGAGNARLFVTPQGGLKREFVFSGSRVSAGPEDSVKAKLQGDNWIIEVNGYEHYIVPLAIIEGG